MCLNYGAEQRPDQSAQRHKSTHMRPVTDRTQKSDKAVGIRVEMVGTRSGSEGEPSGRNTRAADPIGAEPSGAVQTWAMRTRAIVEPNRAEPSGAERGERSREHS